MGLTVQGASAAIGLARQRGLVRPEVAEQAIHLLQARPEQPITPQLLAFVLDLPADAVATLLHDGESTMITPQATPRTRDETRSRRRDGTRASRARSGGTRADEDSTGHVIQGEWGSEVTAVAEDLLTSGEPPSATQTTRVPGRTGGAGALVAQRAFGPYEVIEAIGHGGMGVVYRARRKSDGEFVAIKLMRAKIAGDEAAGKRFRREMDVMCALRHPNLVGYLDHAFTGSALCLVMEFLPGGDVARLMARRGGRLSLGEAAPIILDALAGVACLHDAEIVHRDLKPKNILLASSEGGPAKVSDFGLAKCFQKAGKSSVTASGTFAGTPGFMPPEQVTNFKYVKPASDVWGLGATLYHMLTGQLPFDFPPGQEPASVIARGRIVAVQQRDASIPPRLAEVIDRSISARPKERYGTAAELRAALEQVL